MAEETKKTDLQREYVIPLRRAFLKAPQHDRMRIAIREIRRFLVRHMKLYDRDTRNVKIDMFFNNNLWFRGRKSPPSKVKVKATKVGNVVRVDFVDMPEYVKFHKAKVERRNKKVDVAEKPEVKEEKTSEEKKEEKEKEQSVAQANEKLAESQAKAQKHIIKPEKTQHPQRMALQK
jgi:ribosomal protein L31E